MKAHYEQWIADIGAAVRAAGTTQPLTDHIMKHATQDLSWHIASTRPQWQAWSASMHNLLAIFDDVFLGGAPCIEARIERLRNKSTKDPNVTPEPV